MKSFFNRKQNTSNSSRRNENIAASLGIRPEAFLLLKSLFFPEFYRRQDAVPVAISDKELFEHFVAVGIWRDLAPGPLFDPAFVKAQVTASGCMDERPALVQWLANNTDCRIVPTPLFDEAAYLGCNEDVRAAGGNAFEHFVHYGQFEGRSLGQCAIVDQAIRLRATASRTPVADLLSCFPHPSDPRIVNPDTWADLERFFQTSFYGAQTGVQQGPIEEPRLSHYLGVGQFVGVRPTIFFHEQYYREQLERRVDDVNSTNRIIGGVTPFLHWCMVGRELRIVPTPLFSEVFYADSYPDLIKWKGWLFEHFIESGCREAMRSPSIAFSTSYYRKKKPKIANEVHLLDFVLENPAGISPGPDIDLSPFAAETDLRIETSIERFAHYLAKKMDGLDSPVMRDMIARAEFIEPQIRRPYGPRQAQFPPIKHLKGELLQRAERIRLSLQQTHYDSVVLIPHCRMAGSARVAGELVKTIGQLAKHDRLLLVQTDRSDFERPEWFGNHADIVDLAAECKNAEGTVAVDMLMDLLRGVRPARIINVNSSLGWTFLERYGRQFSTWTHLFAYLFTWDLDARGNKGGYPIVGFQRCFDSLAGVLVDNTFLVDELRERYSLPRSLCERIHVVHTPGEPSSLNLTEVFTRRRAQGRQLTAMWCGRFDRQKRFDVVLEIARSMPELQLWVWGKPVLGDAPFSPEDVPPNVKFNGTYNQFDDLPLESMDFFLYTSAWDGLPTILIDAGARGLAVVASRVGGTSDLVNEETAWPVDQTESAAAYVGQIRAMVAMPEEVTRRAENLRVRTNTLCSKGAYLDSLRKVLYE